MKILIVDDEEVIRDSLSGFLLSEGHDCHTAANGAEALKYLESEVPDVVFADIKMPMMSGLELLESIKEIFPGDVIPVIVITGHANNEEEIQAVQQGADAIIRKPIQTREVRIALKRINHTKKCIRDI